MALEKINKVNVSEQVYEQLKNNILSHEWNDGEKLPSENELSEIFGVSRVSIRQALQKLTIQGLIETRVGEGSFVKLVDITEQLKSSVIPSVFVEYHGNRDVLDYRIALESGTVGIAARIATEDDIIRLRELIEMQRAVTGKSLDEFSKQGHLFHFEIAKITQNSLIIASYEMMQEILKYAIKDVVHTIGYRGIEEHELIVDAIERHDSDEAIASMKRHTELVKQIYLNAID